MKRADLRIPTTRRANIAFSLKMSRCTIDTAVHFFIDFPYDAKYNIVVKYEKGGAL